MKESGLKQVDRHVRQVREAKAEGSSAGTNEAIGMLCLPISSDSNCAGNYYIIALEKIIKLEDRIENLRDKLEGVKGA